MAKYRKKPVEVEAIQWKGDLDNFTELVHFANVTKYHPLITNEETIQRIETLNLIHIQTLEGVMEAQPGDYIIKGVQGEFYPCKPDIFHTTYEQVGD